MNNDVNNSIRLIIPEELTRDRFVKSFELSKEDAKKIALANGVIWDVE